MSGVAAAALVAAGGLWLAAALLGPLATRRIGLRAVALASGLGGLAALAGDPVKALTAAVAVQVAASGTRHISHLQVMPQRLGHPSVAPSV